jgi:hypothetical protein
MPALDIFGSSAFTMVALTDAINKMPFVPGRIGQLGLFREQGVSTTSVMIEEREGSLTLVETTSRGAPAVQHVANKRKARSLGVPHIALEDTILGDEVQNVRAFGSENMLEGVQAVVNQRLTEMTSKMDATLEHLRVGAIKGQILDADGTAVIYDLFTEFGVTAYTEIDFDLDNASPAPGAVKKKCHDIRRKIEDELGVVSRCGSSPDAPILSSALARPASMPRPRPSSCARAKLPTRARAISSPSAARPSPSRASRSGAIPISSCGRLMCERSELQAALTAKGWSSKPTQPPELAGAVLCPLPFTRA